MKIAISMRKDKSSYSINSKYLELLFKSNMIPILVTDAHINKLDEIAEMSDGLILPGGADVEPTYYGMQNFASNSPDPDLDYLERQLYLKFKSHNKPILGICRGLQLIFLEESFVLKEVPKCYVFKQHLDKHLQTPRVARHIPTHKIVCKRFLYEPSSKMNKHFEMFVNSMHHQGIKLKSKANPVQLLPLALSTDGVVEAFHLVGTKIFAVQWHPEELLDVALVNRVFRGETKCQSLNINVKNAQNTSKK